MLDKLKQITTFIFDVDGVLTDGNILVTETGEQLRTFNTKDGYALQLAVKMGFNLCIISGGSSLGILKRMNGLGIVDVYLGVQHKLSVYSNYVKNNNLHPKEIIFIGDDMPDIPTMKLVGLAACPANAANDIKEISHYISPYNGGAGVARDIIEKVLKIQGKWLVTNPDASDGGKV